MNVSDAQSYSTVYWFGELACISTCQWEVVNIRACDFPPYHCHCSFF
jgi:hypothetical protein